MPEDCIFCKILDGSIPAKRVYEDDATIAFLDINPRNPGHTLVVLKRHAEAIADMRVDETGRLFEAVKKVADAAKEAARADGISICQNNGKAAGQVVAHVHVHVIPRFNNEGPPSMESILQVKKLADQDLGRIADAIRASIGVESYSPREEMRMARKEKPEKKEEKKPAKEEKEDLDDDFEEFSVDDL
ncbi:MAG: HIT domain-containing protein [Candidatus Aenigmarchaeota archaeon]|nr:HIT domain-containing protein [Candidatus Aenigmarchaeota archaeon]